MELQPILGIKKGVTAVIGSGGKSTLLHTLAQELPGRILLCTSTHFMPYDDLPTLTEPTEETLRQAFTAGRVVCAGRETAKGKLTDCGLPYEILADLADYVLVEADGSRRMPLKFHREDEPCIPAETGLLLQVAGLSALGRPAAETLHRHALSGIAAEHCIAEEDVARLMLRAFSHCGVSCPGAALLNQADTPELCARGETVARLLRAEGYPCAVGALRKEVIGCWS